MMAAEISTTRLRRVGRILVLALLAAGVALAVAKRGALDPTSIAAALAAAPATPLLFLAAHVLASLLFVPRTVLAVAAGLLFGMGWGLVWATLGSVLGAVAGFLVARYVNAGLIEPERMKRLGPLLQRAETGGWRAVTALRLIPVIPHSLANYALGLTRLPVASYALGSFLGQLPMTVAYVDFGAAGERMMSGKADWLLPTVIGAAALALSILLPLFARARRQS
jgi:uncharacterized membrane protein YdjX (TVP38/TMEM64 family)